MKSSALKLVRGKRMTPPDTSELPLAVGIGRVSLENQVGGFSPAQQADSLPGLANQHGFRMPADYVLADDGFQGDDFERPGLEDALEKIRNGLARAVVFPTVDRMARDVEGGLRLVRQFHELGAPVIIGDIGLFPPGTPDFAMKMMLNMKLTFAENEKATIRGRVRKAMKQMRDEGKLCGAAAFGYRYTIPGEPSSWEADPEQVPVLLDIFERIAQGGPEGSLRMVVAHLVATQAAGRDWNVAAVKFIIANRAYLGTLVRGRYDLVKPEVEKRRKVGTALHDKRTRKIENPKSQWTTLPVPQLVPTELWEAANAQQARRRDIARGRPSTRYPLRGLLYCDVCKERGRGYRTSRGVPRYRCSCASGLNQKGQRVSCSNPSMLAAALEATVLDAAMEVFADLPGLEKQLRDQPKLEDAKQRTSDSGKMRERVDALKRREQFARKKEIESVDDASTAEFYAEEVKRFAGQRRMLERQMGTTALPVGRTDTLRELWRPLQEQLQRKNISPEGQRALLEALVTRVAFKNGTDVSIELRIPIRVKKLQGGDGNQANTNCSPRPGVLNNYTPLVLHRKLKGLAA